MVNINKYTRKIVRQVGYLQGSYRDARSTKHKIVLFVVFSNFQSAILRKFFSLLYIYIYIHTHTHIHKHTHTHTHAYTKEMGRRLKVFLDMRRSQDKWLPIFRRTFYLDLQDFTMFNNNNAVKSTNHARNHLFINVTQ